MQLQKALSDCRKGFVGCMTALMNVGKRQDDGKKKANANCIPIAIGMADVPSGKTFAAQPHALNIPLNGAFTN